MEFEKTSLGKPNALLRAMRLYHRYDVRGGENLPKSGRALIVVNHSLATYDLVLLFHAIEKFSGRIARPLADRFFFRVPGMSWIATRYGGVEANPQTAEELLSREELVLVAPGGMYEMVRPSREKYQLRWGERKGFVRLAITTQTPIILAVCPRADDLFKVYETPVTELSYRYLHFPLVLFRGIGPTLIPRPTKLVHRIDRPILPPVCSKTERGLEAQVDALHEKITKRARELMVQGLMQK